MLGNAENSLLNWGSSSLSPARSLARARSTDCVQTVQVGGRCHPSLTSTYAKVVFQYFYMYHMRDRFNGVRTRTTICIQERYRTGRVGSG